jgi:hypothetical protein
MMTGRHAPRLMVGADRNRTAAPDRGSNPVRDRSQRIETTGHLRERGIERNEVRA